MTLLGFCVGNQDVTRDTYHHGAPHLPQRGSKVKKKRLKVKRKSIKVNKKRIKVNKKSLR